MTTDDAAKRLALQKMAFEVAWRILRVTPVNATALVSALLLTARGVALTLDQLHHTLQDSLDYLERKQTPMTNSALRLRTADGVRAALDALSNGHPITCVEGGREPVWRIAPEDEHQAAFYRNTLIDAFLETSIVELALAYAARAEGNRLEAFWSQTMHLRDLLKFDFYFADSAAFREHVAEEMSWHGDWEAHVAAGGDEINVLLRAKKPLIAGAMLRPFFEAYEIVSDVLRDAPAEIDEKDLTKMALGVGRQYAAQDRVRSNEAVSALLFATARQVAADQQTRPNLSSEPESATSMPGAVDEDFEFLLNLLASDGTEPDPSLGATGSQKAHGTSDRTEGFRIQQGPDGKLDLGQVKTFYEIKNMGKEKEKDPVREDPGLMNPGSRERSGSCFSVRFRNVDYGAVALPRAFRTGC